MDFDSRLQTNKQKEMPFKGPLLIIWSLTVYTRGGQTCFMLEPHIKKSSF